MLLELSLVEQRYDAVMEVLRDGLQVSEVARRYGVSRQSLHVWLRRYEEGGLKGLADRSHRPTGARIRSPLRWRLESWRSAAFTRSGALGGSPMSSPRKHGTPARPVPACTGPSGGTTLSRPTGDAGATGAVDATSPVRAARGLFDSLGAKPDLAETDALDDIICAK